MSGVGSQVSGFGKVAVLMGGASAERAISLKSGQAVLDALRAQGIDAHGLDPVEPGFLDRLREEGFERAFVVLHGRGGEDGVMQGALELLGLPYTGSGVLGSALAMDKVRSKQVWQAVGLPTPRWVTVRADRKALGEAAAMPMPVIVKPAREGSSLGMEKVEAAAELEAAVDAALEYDDRVLVEQWIEGAEYTAAILGGQVLPLIRLETPRSFYDYAAKYEADSTRYICPCGLAAEKERAYQALALEAFTAVGASGWGRVDFMVDGERGRPYLIEANTVPGMTDHSLVPMAARAAGMDFEQLVCRILATSLDRDGQRAQG